jgi:hypothetical protein
MLTVEVARVLVVAVLSGRDSNHKTYPTVPKDPNWFLVGPEYHALHHVDPAAYIGSSFRVFDWLFGTGYSLRSRRVTMTGAFDAFGGAMKKEFEKILPEIWYIGSEAELHPSWGIPNIQSYSLSKRLFLPYARAIYDDPSVL